MYKFTHRNPHIHTIIETYYSYTLVHIYLILLHVHNNVRIHKLISDKTVHRTSKLKLRNDYIAYK